MVQEINPKDEEFATPSGPDVTYELPQGKMTRPKRSSEEWREEFPYPWDEDDIVTRRDTLRFLLAGSGALFLATGALAIIGNLPSGPDVKAVAVAKVGELAENKWKVFDFPDQYAQGILINLPGNRLVAYSDVC